MDLSVPFQHAVSFCDEMKKHGNRCELIPFEERDHGSFNWKNGDNPDFFATMNYTVKFLISIGYLKKATVKE